ncbi:MAG TPA: riboflavin synthase [Bacteroidota bacterium]|nr:riboflavin synthase [Bacteroidota bacterium]
MFTGIIEETGTVADAATLGDGIDFSFTADIVTRGLGVDNSIAINGTCLTVTKKKGATFRVHAMHETLTKTNLGQLKKGMKVNLERAVSLEQRLGGHLVQGHVDGVGTVTKIETLETSSLYTISIDKKFRKYLIPVGSVAVDGVSLTVARLGAASFTVAIIPYTLEHTIFNTYTKGTNVNIEFDLIGKYIESLMKH